MTQAIRYDENRLEGLTLHHEAKGPGYVRKKIPGEMYIYHGMFGDGILVKKNLPGSNRYCRHLYYIREV